MYPTIQPLSLSTYRSVPSLILNAPFTRHMRTSYVRPWTLTKAQFNRCLFPPTGFPTIPDGYRTQEQTPILSVMSQAYADDVGTGNPAGNRLLLGEFNTKEVQDAILKAAGKRGIRYLATTTTDQAERAGAKKHCLLLSNGKEQNVTSAFIDARLEADMEIMEGVMDGFLPPALKKEVRRLKDPGFLSTWTFIKEYGVNDEPEVIFDTENNLRATKLSHYKSMLDYLTDARDKYTRVCDIDATAVTDEQFNNLKGLVFTHSASSLSLSP